MHEGAAAPSYLRPGLGLRRAGVSVRKQRLRTSSRAKRGLRNPQNRLCGSRLEALWASKSASPTATAKSEILTPRRWSGPSGRFRYHFTSRPNLGFAGLGFRFCGALWAVLEPPAAQSAAFDFSPRAAFHLPGVPALRSAKALSSGLQPRKRGLRPAVTEGDKRREGVSPTSDGELKIRQAYPAKGKAL